jgi:hypothetical protein
VCLDTLRKQMSVIGSPILGRQSLAIARIGLVEDRPLLYKLCALAHKASRSVTAQGIKGSHLSKEEQDDLRRQISSIPVVIRAVGDHQKNGSNGDTAPSEKTRPKNKAKSKLTASKRTDPIPSPEVTL